jgi:hypothetical protein
LKLDFGDIEIVKRNRMRQAAEDIKAVREDRDTSGA